MLKYCDAFEVIKKRGHNIHLASYSVSDAVATYYFITERKTMEITVINNNSTGHTSPPVSLEDDIANSIDTPTRDKLVVVSDPKSRRSKINGQNTWTGFRIFSVHLDVMMIPKRLFLFCLENGRLSSKSFCHIFELSVRCRFSNYYCKDSSNINQAFKRECNNS